MILLFYKKRAGIRLRALIGFFICVFLLSIFSTYLVRPGYTSALEYMPAPTKLVKTTLNFEPITLRGLEFSPNDPFKFSFIIDEGDAVLSDEQLKIQTQQLIKYFLTSLTTPAKDLWVNLSPYEKDSVIPYELGLTDMGRDLLGEDYILKQLTASLTYPESPLGKEFWKKVYSRAYQLYGTTKIPLNTFNKIWIVPEKCVVHQAGNRAFVKESRLKIMLEEDYLAYQQARLPDGQAGVAQKQNIVGARRAVPSNNISTQIAKEVILPAIEEEVNNGQSFSQLRQIYNALILATWFKKRLRQTVETPRGHVPPACRTGREAQAEGRERYVSPEAKTNILDQIYFDKNKIAGVEGDDPEIKEKIYNQYLEAYKKGVYNYIRRDFDPHLNKKLNRRYYSGGASLEEIVKMVPDQLEVGTSSEHDQLIKQETDDHPTMAKIKIDGIDGALVSGSQLKESPSDVSSKDKSGDIAQIGNQAVAGEVKVEGSVGVVEVFDGEGKKLGAVDLDLEDLDAALLARESIERMDLGDQETGLEFFLAILDLAQTLPSKDRPKLFTFLKLIKDLFGFAREQGLDNPNLIALYRDIYNDPKLKGLALTHEIGEYLLKRGLIKIEVKGAIAKLLCGFGLDRVFRFLTQRGWLKGKLVLKNNQNSEVARLTIEGDALLRAFKNYKLLSSKASGHDLLRAAAKQIMPDEYPKLLGPDKALTTFIKKNQTQRNSVQSEYFQKLYPFTDIPFDELPSGFQEIIKHSQGLPQELIDLCTKAGIDDAKYILLGISSLRDVIIVEDDPKQTITNLQEIGNELRFFLNKIRRSSSPKRKASGPESYLQPLFSNFLTSLKDIIIVEDSIEQTRENLDEILDKLLSVVLNTNSTRESIHEQRLEDFFNSAFFVFKDEIISDNLEQTAENLALLAGIFVGVSDDYMWGVNKSIGERLLSNNPRIIELALSVSEQSTHDPERNEIKVCYALVLGEAVKYNPGFTTRILTAIENSDDDATMRSLALALKQDRDDPAIKLNCNQIMILYQARERAVDDRAKEHLGWVFKGALECNPDVLAEMVDLATNNVQFENLKSTVESVLISVLRRGKKDDSVSKLISDLITLSVSGKITFDWFERIISSAFRDSSAPRALVSDILSALASIGDDSLREAILSVLDDALGRDIALPFVSKFNAQEFEVLLNLIRDSKNKQVLAKASSILMAIIKQKNRDNLNISEAGLRIVLNKFNSLVSEFSDQENEEDLESILALLPNIAWAAKVDKWLDPEDVDSILSALEKTDGRLAATFSYGAIKEDAINFSGLNDKVTQSFNQTENDSTKAAIAYVCGHCFSSQDHAEDLLVLIDRADNEQDLKRAATVLKNLLKNNENVSLTESSKDIFITKLATTEDEETLRELSAVFAHALVGNQQMRPDEDDFKTILSVVERTEGRVGAGIGMVLVSNPGLIVKAIDGIVSQGGISSENLVAKRIAKDLVHVVGKDPSLFNNLAVVIGKVQNSQARECLFSILSNEFLTFLPFSFGGLIDAIGWAEDGSFEKIQLASLLISCWDEKSGDFEFFRGLFGKVEFTKERARVILGLTGDSIEYDSRRFFYDALRVGLIHSQPRLEYSDLESLKEKLLHAADNNQAKAILDIMVEVVFSLKVKDHLPAQTVESAYSMLQRLVESEFVTKENLEVVCDFIVVLHQSQTFIPALNNPSTYDSILPLRSDEISQKFVENTKLLLENGFYPSATLNQRIDAANDPQSLMAIWRVYNPQVNNSFDPNDELKVALEYSRFCNEYVRQCGRESERETYTFEWFREILENFNRLSQDEVEDSTKTALSYTSYEVKKFFDFVVALKNSGRKVLVVPNFSYGWFLATPIKTRLESLGIKIAEVRVGSTEAHDDEHLICAKRKEQLFDDDTLRFMLKEQPEVVMMDGSNSFMRDVQGGSRYPDAHKAFVNVMLLINYVLAGDKFIEGADQLREQEYFQDFFNPQRNEGQVYSSYEMIMRFVDKLRRLKQELAIPDRDANAYRSEYYNPMNRSDISVTMGGRWSNRQVRDKPEAFNPDSIDGLDPINQSRLFVAAVNVSNQDMPDYMRQLNGQDKHLSGSIDDHISKRFVVNRQGVNPSHTFEDEFLRQFAIVERLVDLNEQRAVPVAEKDNLDSLPFRADKRFGGVLLDIDGTLKLRGKKISSEILDLIAGMLEAGYKVGIVSGRSKSIDKVFVRRMRRRVNSEALKNLYVFEQNGAGCYDVGNDEILTSYAIDSQDRRSIVGKLQSTDLEKFGFKVTERSAIIAVDNVTNEQKEELIIALKMALGDLGLMHKYKVVDTEVNLNIVPLEVNKGNAASFFAQQTGIKQKDILKIGNSYSVEGNDYPMLIMPSGVGVDSPDTTRWLLEIFFHEKIPPGQKDVTRRRSDQEGDEIQWQAEYIRQEYEGIRIGVIGAVSPSSDYSPTIGEELGRCLADYVKDKGYVFTGGVPGVGKDVYQGVCSLSQNSDERFFALLPQGMSAVGYSRISPNNRVAVQYIGKDMHQRRVGMAMVADVMIVLNGSLGTIHEAVVALKNNKKVIVLNYGGAGKQLYMAKLNNELTSDLKAEGLELPDLDNVIAANSIEEVSMMLSNMETLLKKAAMSAKSQAVSIPSSRVDIDPNSRSHQITSDEEGLSDVVVPVTSDADTEYFPPLVSPLTIANIIHGLHARFHEDGRLIRRVHLNRKQLEEQLSDLADKFGRVPTLEEAIRFVDGHETAHALFDEVRLFGRLSKGLKEQEEELANFFGLAFAGVLKKEDMPLGLMMTILDVERLINERLPEGEKIDGLYEYLIDADPFDRKNAKALEKKLEKIGINVEVDVTERNLSEIKAEYKDRGAEILKPMEINRRSFFKAAGVGAVSLGVGPVSEAIARASGVSNRSVRNHDSVLRYVRGGIASGGDLAILGYSHADSLKYDMIEKALSNNVLNAASSVRYCWDLFTLLQTERKVMDSLQKDIETIREIAACGKLAMLGLELTHQGVERVRKEALNGHRHIIANMQAHFSNVRIYIADKKKQGNNVSNLEDIVNYLENNIEEIADDFTLLTYGVLGYFHVHMRDFIDQVHFVAIDDDLLRKEASVYLEAAAYYGKKIVEFLTAKESIDLSDRLYDLSQSTSIASKEVLAIMKEIGVEERIPLGVIRNYCDSFNFFMLSAKDRDRAMIENTLHEASGIVGKDGVAMTVVGGCHLLGMTRYARELSGKNELGIKRDSLDKKDVFIVKPVKASQDIGQFLEFLIKAYDDGDAQYFKDLVLDLDLNFQWQTHLYRKQLRSIKKALLRGGVSNVAAVGFTRDRGFERINELVGLIDAFTIKMENLGFKRNKIEDTFLTLYGPLVYLAATSSRFFKKIISLDDSLAEGRQLVDIRHDLFRVCKEYGEIDLFMEWDREVRAAQSSNGTIADEKILAMHTKAKNREVVGTKVVTACAEYVSCYWMNRYHFSKIAKRLSSEVKTKGNLLVIGEKNYWDKLKQAFDGNQILTVQQNSSIENSAGPALVGANLFDQNNEKKNHLDYLASAQQTAGGEVDATLPNTNPGGIDLNPEMLEIDEESQTGGSIAPFSNFESLPFDIKTFKGFTFQIITIERDFKKADQEQEEPVFDLAA
ncbi:MAG: HAD-IIB family hydrolase [Candidatus Omnitrophica bacterium]|nr:HAD-IIB family hydrolase [Candidatus Omnitrophota bacterium]